MTLALGRVAAPNGAASRDAAYRGRLALAAAAAVGATALCAASQPHLKALARPPTNLRSRQAARRKPRISWLAVDAVSGAVGEIASLVVLYPLDSLKVLCQARGASTAAVLRELRASGRPGDALRQLYAGCGSAALCSAAIGAVYLLAFYSAKRLATAAATAAARQQQGASASSSSSGGGGGGGSQLADGSARHPPLNSEGTHPLVASAAGLAASLAGSVFEAPMEMFKLRTQAGALSGPMLASMFREASSRGLGSLYATYAAFMLKSVPYDVAELATYSQMCDWREAAAARAAAGPGAAAGAGEHWRERVGAALARLPSSASDMLIGAAAGAASVLVSMPCDVIKTRMDLAPPACPPGGAGLLCSARAFVDTGRQLVAAGGGPRALFVGVAPRLLQTVPSTMVYWAAVEGARRFMRQAFDVDGAPEAEAPAPAAAAPPPAVVSSSAAGAALASSSSSSRSSSIGSGGGCTPAARSPVQLAAAAAPSSPAPLAVPAPMLA